jgi:glucose/arabinose dehydrogenase
MMMRARIAIPFALALATILSIPSARTLADGPSKMELHKGDRIILIGNTLAERMQYFGNFETRLQSRFPDLNLVFHDLGWSADELTLRPRSAGFKDHGHTLEDEKPDVIIAAFGFNESFAGPKGLDKFKKDLEKFITESTTTKYNGKAAPKLVLISPIAHEDLGNPHVTDGKANNENIRLYTAAMSEAAASHHLTFVDLFTPTKSIFEGKPTIVAVQARDGGQREIFATKTKNLTINGIHLNETGDRYVADLIDLDLFGSRPSPVKADMTKLKKEVLEKNLQFFYDYRATNGCYIYGGRKAPFGVVNFPAEFAKLRKMIEKREARVWAVAKGEAVPDTIDDSDTGTLERVQTNAKNPIRLTTPEESRQTFTLPEGYEANLFASEEQFPDLKKPVQMTFDAKGRLWVTTMGSYPMYLPGKPVDDKVLIYEDTDGDGKADKQTIFADKLHVPTGIELGDGGAYVAQQPNLMFLKDTNGDDKADTRDLIMHGFDTADSHHAMHAFTWDPGGALYWQEGTFHHTQVETPYGPQRVANAGVFRFEPKTFKFEVFVSYGFANPWGHFFDRWGQNLVADASGGANYFGTAFSGQVDYPSKHGKLKEFLTKQWRPTSGCELVSSRNFPDETQGDYLLNNVIGFQGVLRYRMKDDGSGFHADPVEPLLRSTDPNYRPVDLEFGPDGALYLVDWYNPLIGHMQHSLRDPNRDVEHGRIWRIQYKKRPLVEKAKIAGASVPELLDLLKAYEDRTRYRARRELREHPPELVLKELDKWVAGLYKNDPEYWHNMLEALWLHQSLDAVDPAMLKTMLTCPEPKARAAATRVLCYWRDQVKDPLELLRKQVNDDNARVRLEAVRALSFFNGKDAAKASEVALESVLLDQDDYLKYTLEETNKTLDRRTKAAGK